MKPDNIYLAVAAVSIPLVTAVLVATLNHFQNRRASQRERHADRLADQIDTLYGPLHFYLCENTDLLRRTGILNDLYTTVYVNTKWSERGMETIHKEADQAIAVNNSYFAKVTENNTAMIRIITDHFSLIVHDDLDALREFVTDVNRYNVEQGLPSRLKLKLMDDPIAFFRPPFADRIAARVKELSDKWSRL
jgi:hypothetical protein